MTPRFTFTFKAALVMEGSWGAHDIGDGAQRCSMEFYEGDDAGHASIEWYVPSLDINEDIGLTFAMRDGRRCLTEYSGVMCLPAQVVRILQHIGIDVPRGDGMDEEIDAAALLKGDDVPVLRTQAEAQAYVERG